MKSYILEVQKFSPELINARFIHIDYMNKLEACKYYDDYYPEMRKLNTHGNWCSDWNPNTFFRYVVREYNGEHLTIPPFI